MTKNIELLKQVLSIPTKTYKEDLMVAYLTKWLAANNIDYYVDNKKNIYATKKSSETLPDDFYYPCVISHTDTVHNLDTINVIEEQLPNAQGEVKLSLKGYNDLGQPTGIGGDDKCGVFACMTLLRELPFLKAAFFVSEETGCHGSKSADPKFFENVGYAIQFDAPGNLMVSEYCMGVQLFDREGDFFDKCDKVLTEGFEGRNEYQSHPYTDVYALKRLFDFSCIKFAIGYYDYHTKNEYVVIEDVYNGIKTGKEMIESLGNNYYPFIKKTDTILR